MRQAANIIEAVKFAKLVDLPWWRISQSTGAWRMSEMIPMARSSQNSARVSTSG